MSLFITGTDTGVGKTHIAVTDSSQQYFGVTTISTAPKSRANIAALTNADILKRIPMFHWLLTRRKPDGTPRGLATYARIDQDSTSVLS